MKFKGHTKIELRDVNTGEVKVYEDDNMFTNALGKIVDFAAKHNWKDTLNLYASHLNLISSVCMFDSAITENADNVWLPAGVKPVGYGTAGDTNSFTNRPEWGIYNTQESDTTSDTTKKWVWDFATSHANGRIAAVALTHCNTGELGFGASSWSNMQRQYRQDIVTGTMLPQSKAGKQGRNNYNVGTMGTTLAAGGTYVSFCIDSVNNLKWMFKVCEDGVSVISHSMNAEKFDPFRSSVDWQDYTEETYSETFSGSYFFNFYNTDEKCLYFWIAGNADAWTGSGSVSIHKYDLVNKTLTKDWKTFIFTATNTQYTGTNFVVTNSAVYYAQCEISTGNKFKKYEFSSGITTEIGSDDVYFIGTVQGRKSYILNGRIYWYFGKWNNLSQGIRSYTIIIDTYDDEILYTNIGHNTIDSNGSQTSRWNIVPPIDNTQMIFGNNLDADEYQSGAMNLQDSGTTTRNDVGNTFSPCHYLATINNLSEPVIKTATQTMKLTYTITAVEME